MAWVFPAATVASALSDCHKVWLATPGKNGRAHQDNNMRRLLPGYDHLKVVAYRSGWMSQYLDACGELEPELKGDSH